MDEFQVRALGNLRKRHEDRIRAEAKHLREYATYVLARLDGAQPATANFYAGDIAAAAREIDNRFAALEAITEAAGIFEATGD